MYRISLKLIVLTAVLSVLVLATTGCAPLLVGGVAVAGASAIHDRRPAQTILDDRQIEFTAAQALFQDPDIGRGARIIATSYNRSVLLTGQASSAELARRASERISRLPRVARVIDEIQSGAPISIQRQSEDLYLASRAKLELVGIELPDFDPTRVKVIVEDGVLYLMGLVTPREGEATAQRLSRIPGVRKVVKLFEYWVPNA